MFPILTGLCLIAYVLNPELKYPGVINYMVLLAYVYAWIMDLIFIFKTRR